MDKSALQNLLDQYIDAEEKVLKGMQIQFQGKMLTRASLAEIRKGRLQLERRIRDYGRNTLGTLVDLS